MYIFKVDEKTSRVNINKHWQFCVGSGQAKLALRADYAKHLKFVHDELGIQRVRFHGIFDDSMQAYMGVDDFMPIPGASNFNDYAFNQIGNAYENVLSAGMQPWVELSFMPSRLAKKKKQVTVNANGCATMPRDDKEWQAFISQFVRYLINRFGKEEVEQWYFEVWNEPNMSSFFKGTKDDYFHLYEITATAVKEVDSTIKVGGPATAEGAWIGEFIEFCESKKLPLDFISTHNYPGDGIGDIFLAKVMLEALIGGVKNMRKLKKGDTLTGLRALMVDKTEEMEYPKGQMYIKCKKVHDEVADRYPIFFTEWNCNALLTSESNETRKPACFQVKSASEMDGLMEGSSIWSFSDEMDEFMLLPDEFPGGWGFVTQHQIPRPQFYAMKLMAETGGRKYQLPRTNDEVEIDVYESDTEKQLFVFRQRMKNVKEASEEYRVEFELTSKPERVVLYRIDEEHCNPYRIYKEMGSPKNLSPAQIEEIKSKSSLIEESVEFEYNDGVLILNNTIGVNDVHCYKIG